MQIEIAEHERMSESGSSLLRLIQNNDTCRLDLLVRESIQNCLDAGDRQSESVRVDYDIVQFQTNEVSGFFDKISDRLNQRFPGKRSCIAIRDRNTVGLTGPIRYADVRNGNFGNLLKLVYEISKPQDQSGSGGSWGLGKTVYFRIGVGLVIYYSRVKSDAFGKKYESRLAAALVEDETGRERLLPQQKNIQRGIAWWGATDGFGGKHTVPVTREKEIGRILEAFNVVPFDGEETGTMILIPFIDEKKLLNETIPVETEDGTPHQVPYWCRDGLAEYLKISVQRWYAPRLNNKAYKGQYLEMYINGKRLTQEDTAPIFRLIQVLYNATPDDDLEFNGRKVTSKPVELRRIFEKGSGRAGFINYMKVTAEDMKMLPPDNNPNPYYYINRLSSESMYNDPIVLYVRKPGMVVSYSTTGDWTDSIPKTDIGEYIVGVFVANSDNRLAQNKMLLEEYIRKGEKADHMAWDDWTLEGKNPQIISRIKKNVRKKIKDDYATITKGGEEKKNFGLGKMLADIIMPPEEFSYWDDARGGGGGSGGSGGSDGPVDIPAGSGGSINRTSHVILRQTGQIIFTADGIRLPVRILFGQQNEAVLEMRIDAEKSSIPGSQWERQVGTAFPIALKSFTITSMTKGKGRRPTRLVNGEIPVTEDTKQYGIDISFTSTEKFGIRSAIRITVNEVDNVVLDGFLIYEAREVQGSVALKGES